MSDDKTQRDAPDNTRIDIHDPDEVRHWSQSLGVTAEQLKEAVARVGTSSIELDHEVRLPDGRLAASGKSILVAWDLVARTKRSLSEAERAALTS